MKNWPTIQVNGFTARVTHEDKYLYVVPVGGMREGVSVPVDGRVTSAVVARAVASVDFDVEYVGFTHYRYVSYMLRSIMRERSGSYTRTARYTLDDSGKWVASRRKLENGIY